MDVLHTWTRHGGRHLSMSIVDLMSDTHDWLDAGVAGADRTVRMYPLHVDLQRGTRTVLVSYPDGWSRETTGTQPAGEELVPLAGAFSMSGHRAAVGEVLWTTPRALRTATSTDEGTRAIIFYSGSGGGWEDGVSSAVGTVERRTIGTGVVRPEADGLVGRLELVEEVPADGFEVDAEIVWVESSRYAFVPRGGLPPAVPGRALVRLLD